MANMSQSSAGSIVEDWKLVWIILRTFSLMNSVWSENKNLGSWLVALHINSALLWAFQSSDAVTSICRS